MKAWFKPKLPNLEKITWPFPQIQISSFPLIGMTENKNYYHEYFWVTSLFWSVNILVNELGWLLESTWLEARLSLPLCFIQFTLRISPFTWHKRHCAASDKGGILWSTWVRKEAVLHKTPPWNFVNFRTFFPTSLLLRPYVIGRGF